LASGSIEKKNLSRSDSKTQSSDLIEPKALAWKKEPSESNLSTDGLSSESYSPNYYQQCRNWSKDQQL
jgi:hypothetical protein